MYVLAENNLTVCSSWSTVNPWYTKGQYVKIWWYEKEKYRKSFIVWKEYHLMVWEAWIRILKNVGKKKKINNNTKKWACSNIIQLMIGARKFILVNGRLLKLSFLTTRCSQVLWATYCNLRQTTPFQYTNFLSLGDKLSQSTIVHVISNKIAP